MNRIVYIAILVFCTHSLLGQNKLTNAVYSLKKGELDKAKQLVDAASEDSLFIDRAATWYYKGFIYKDLFKRDELNNKQSPYREQAISFYLKSYALDSSGTYSKSVINGIEFLALTLYNHSFTSFNPTDYPIAIANYERYKDVYKQIEPNKDFTKEDLNLNMAMAGVYGRMALQDTTNAAIHFDKAKEYYENALALDSNNVKANYNLGILYYNEGVDLIDAMDYGLDLFELEMMQDQVTELFKKSLPYMKKAYDLNPTKKETLEGLQGIYYSLHDIPKSEVYKKELQELTESEPEEETPEAPEDGEDKGFQMEEDQ